MIGSTKTRARLKVKAKIDKRKYPTGIKVSDIDIGKENLKKDKFHGEWNYTVINMKNKSCSSYFFLNPKCGQMGMLDLLSFLYSRRYKL
ncbi:MAG: hypothetical protein MRK02_09175 [Candidatus Scalindua sp.]|nr:hypothetical protein [Candidatus Scalindua sp.]